MSGRQNYKKIENLNNKIQQKYNNINKNILNNNNNGIIIIIIT